ncbi:hypothetical protein [Streptomyces sp. bgisy060]|uniref:hypothetical protein n=1 Tax=Streptomyces sp. bgisy060 TaxID=3413775 RepID=UPI003EBF2475
MSKIRRWASLAAGCTLTLAALPPAAAQAKPANATYRLTITDAWIVDIQGKIDYDACADVFGHVSVWAGEKDGFKLPFDYFRAREDGPVEVCEPNRPLNEGTQVGHLRPNRKQWEKLPPVTIRNDENPKHAGWRFQVNLWDHDPVGKNDAICNHGKSEWIEPKGSGTAHVWSCEADTTFTISYEIDRVG